MPIIPVHSFCSQCDPLSKGVGFVRTITCLLIVHFIVFLAPAPSAHAQSQSPTATVLEPAEMLQRVPPVVTNIVVHADTDIGYLPDTLTIGNIDGAPLLQTPISVTVVTRDLLTDQFSRVLSDVVKNDASIGEDYAPVGYYGDFQIRGIPIDLATGLQINGMTIAGEQDVPLENKERVEFLKGIAGIENGVASAGGLINYVTKCPATIQALDLATDHRGTAYGAVDMGRIFGMHKQFGLRINLAGEEIKSYVNGANGWRTVGTAAADWKISSKAHLLTDFEYQHKVERSVNGYQLLGGTTLPDLDRISPSTLPGLQPWSMPNTFDTFNTGARVNYNLSHGWHAWIAASYSHSLIDDNVVYAYGSALSFDPATQSYDISNCPGAPGSPVYFFCPDGTYGISDYRDPGELRIDAQAKAVVLGHIRTGAISHDLAIGGEIFIRSVQQPSAAVYAYIGSENIYQPVVPVSVGTPGSLEYPRQSAGPRTLYDDNHQTALLIQDRIHLTSKIQLLLGGRINSLRDHNQSASQFTDKLLWLPQYALTYTPLAPLTFYANYGVMLSLGPQAPFWVDNSSQLLAPFRTRQVEVGAKFEPRGKLLITAALFHARTPFFYPKQIQSADSFCMSNVTPGDLCFESGGHETLNGIELNAEGNAASWLRLTASSAGIRAISTETGTSAFDNKQAINVPRLRTTLFADIGLAHAHGIHLLPGWSYTASKEATRDDFVTVPSYNLFNIGASYQPGGENGRCTLRIFADNITDKRYWKDTGANYGDIFLHLGAPTTIRISAHYTFQPHER